MLEDIRKIRKMTRKELAEKTGISIRTIESYEQGLRNIKKAKLENIEKLAEVLNCDIKEITEKSIPF